VLNPGIVASVYTLEDLKSTLLTFECQQHLFPPWRKLIHNQCRILRTGVPGEEDVELRNTDQ
jgi:hypothetical protein